MQSKPPGRSAPLPIPSLEEKAVFCRQLATLVGAGVPIISSLEVLSRSGDRTAPYANLLVRKVGAGTSFATALNQFPDVFDAVFVGQIRTGEESGRLTSCLNQLSFMLERDLNQTRRIKAALTYPAVLFVACIGVLLFFVVFVVPALTPMFETMKLTLPWPTRVLLWSRSVAVPMVLSAVVLIILSRLTQPQQRRFWEKRPELRRQLDASWLQIPLIGKVYHNIITARLLQAMATLLENGQTITATLSRTAGLANNKEISTRIHHARKSIEDGETLSKALDGNKVFPRAVTLVLVAAEESSNLAESFQRMANFYDDEVQTSLDSATALAEPVIMAVMGCISGFIAIAAVLPTLEMIRHF